MPRPRPQVTEDSKFCNGCKSFRLFSEFLKNKRTFDGLSNDCKTCHKRASDDWRKRNPQKVRDKTKRWREKNPEKLKTLCKEWTKNNPEKVLDSSLRRKYGISLTDYNNMLYLQHSCCAGCGVHQDSLPVRLSVDHDHVTGEVRGLLCGPCNKILGLAKDSLATLKNLTTYLQENL